MRGHSRQVKKDSGETSGGPAGGQTFEKFDKRVWHGQRVPLPIFQTCLSRFLKSGPRRAIKSRQAFRLISLSLTAMDERGYKIEKPRITKDFEHTHMKECSRLSSVSLHLLHEPLPR
jgi:hypothetical protein